MITPRYRTAITGSVSLYITDCASQMRNELQNADHLILGVEDTSAWVEFADYLTDREMRAAFKRARAS